MRRSVTFFLGLLCLAPSGLASAGPFGGFSRDGGSFLVDGTRVCQPVAGKRGAPRCQKAGADEVARLGFRKGSPQRGASATVQVQASGTRLVVRSSDGKSVRADWDSGDPVGAVGAVYLSQDGRLVAVEYDARLAGRTQQQVIVLALSGASPTPASPTPGAKPAPGASPSPGAKPAPGAKPTPDDPKLAAQLRAGDKLLAGKKWNRAEEEYRRALALAADHPAARYGLAASLAGQGRTADAVAEVTALARSSHPQAPRWLVEARLGSHFTRVQSDPGFRRAVGIERDPARQPSAYERLVGLGGKWEQTGSACQEPTVALNLDRKSEKFQLSIRTRCQGDDETTRLSGSWSAEGSALRLRFPNPDGPEESLDCKLAASSDRSGEDTLACALDDLTFTMRVVRR